jgi:RHS repeat-associated protein
MAYTYDGDGERVEKSNGSSGTLYWYSPSGRILEETDLAGNYTNDYIYFAGQRLGRVTGSNGTVYFYFGDAIGSARTITDATGHICYDADFYPFGDERSHTTTCGQNYKFAGMERDSETSFDHTQYRQYYSSWGRWMSPDPAGLAAADLTNPQSLNRYAYALNSPTNFVDPLGLDAYSDPCTIGGVPDGEVGWNGQGVSINVTCTSGYTISVTSWGKAPSPPAQVAQPDGVGLDNAQWGSQWSQTISFSIPGGSTGGSGGRPANNVAKIITALQKCGAAGNAAAASAGNDLAQMNASGHIQVLSSLPNNAAGNTTVPPFAVLGLQTPTIQVTPDVTASTLVHEWIHKTQIFGNPLGQAAVAVNKVWARFFGSQGEGPLDPQADTVADKAILLPCRIYQ